MNLALPASFVESLEGDVLGARADDLVAKVQVADLQAPALETVHTTVAPDTSTNLERIAAILGTKKGFAFWLIQELGPLQVQMLCRKRGVRVEGGRRTRRTT